ncbi:hypothetical protein CIHG_05633 [Coccidioides immitis H538.4]|uniref:Uncharacterized protein n=3 Tax=Coccidioides immitis TaxID=5501 RepID=A0A0J8R1W3_COCIT|nr:hypothetical protein CIRG_08416 [Coccidioides immitis RMSCC 2394]KMU78726.1 hypothetical protein CISG_01766 [Coccidioides immitis RMSCC 3703]KMU87866.1 hypothetical protein CIHG_05633 [Coccidioides immitis H538.4]
MGLVRIDEPRNAGSRSINFSWSITVLNHQKKYMIDRAREKYSPSFRVRVQIGFLASVLLGHVCLRLVQKVIRGGKGEDVQQKILSLDEECRRFRSRRPFLFIDIGPETSWLSTRRAFII